MDPPDALAREIRHAADLVTGFVDSLPGLDDPHTYLSDAEKGIEQAVCAADRNAGAGLARAYHAASLGALSCALENRARTGLHAELLVIMAAVEKDARAHGGLQNPSTTAWETAARTLVLATGDALRRRPYEAEDSFIALAAHLVVWAVAIDKCAQWLP